MEMINAIGRRKSAVARVYLTEGTGKITINKKDISVYFPSAILQYVVKQPLLLLEAAEKYDIKANLDGGGFTGQSQALRLAIARALVKVNAEDKKNLKDHGFLTRDARVVERNSSSASVNVWFAVLPRGEASLAFSIQTDKTRHGAYNRNGTGRMTQAAVDCRIRLPAGWF